MSTFERKNFVRVNNQMRDGDSPTKVMFDSMKGYNNLLDEEANKYGEMGSMEGSPSPHVNMLNDLYNSKNESMLD